MLSLYESNSFVKITHKFSAIRVMSGRMTPANFTLKLTVTPAFNEPSSTDEDDSMSEKAGTGFQKIKAWLDIALCDTVLIEHNDPFNAALLEHQDNRIMHTPMAPDDYVLAVLLYYKSRTLLKGQLDVHSISLLSSDTEYTERVYCPTLEEPILPGIEYLNGKTLYDKPWWNRPSIETIDYVIDDQKESQGLRSIIEQANTEFFEMFDIEKDKEAEIVELNEWLKQDD